MQIRRILLALLLSSGMCVAQQLVASSLAVLPQPTRAEYLKLAVETENALNTDVIAVWFPRSVDREHGGFHTHFTRDWQWAPSDGKAAVMQGRMTWVASQVILHDPKRKAEFLPIVRQGVSYLRNVMWDKRDGGFFWLLDDDGHFTPEFAAGKHLYGIAFCIYGLAAAYQATGDSQALDLAKEAYLWIGKHAHDSAHGGYYEWLARDGTPVKPDVPGGQLAKGPIGPVGFKSMNTHIHLLEAFTELYRVWPDPALRARLEEMLAIVRDRICVEPGLMNLYFTGAWQPIPDHDSYGHDVETAYLMLETDELLHRKASAKTERMAKLLVDRALACGWDEKNGGFFQEGTTMGKPEDTRKEWWVQAEGLNALLMMHERYGKQDPIYFRRFHEQWDFMKNHTIDAEFHGLYNLTTADGTPIAQDKGSIWKGGYHDGRAFWNVSARLRKLAGEEGHRPRRTFPIPEISREPGRDASLRPQDSRAAVNPESAPTRPYGFSRPAPILLYTGVFMAIETRLPIGILGATGMVGQRFIQLLEHHPWFQVAWIAASDRSSGKPYGEAAKWRLDTPLPERIAQMTVRPAEPFGAPKIVFAALDAAIARELEPRFAEAGCAVVSNSSAFRMAPNVPLVIPEINAEHLHLIEEQPSRRESGGYMVTNPNCSTIGLVMALKPIEERFGLEQILVTTMQAVSGAGYPGVPSMDILGNVVPYIGSEEEKMEAETLKLLGRLQGHAVTPLPARISAQCNRVAVEDGHTESVSIKLGNKLGRPVAREDLLAAWAEFRPLSGQGLPTAPDQPVQWAPQPDRPQPRLDRNRGNGMAVTVGRLRPCNVLDWKFTVLSHNTIRGAAGAAILNAELLASLGKLEPIAAAAANA